MTRQEAYDYIVAQLAVPVNTIAKFLNSFSKLLDFITESSVTDIIPAWTALLTFNTDGTGDGRYCVHPDANGKKRLFETKTSGNINHEPPTDPGITEDSFWLEISQSGGSAIKEWSPGIYGSDLIIVYHTHSVDGPALYKLNEPSRPFSSTNIETEIAAGKWVPLTINDSQAPAVIHTNTATVGNVGGGEDILFSFSLPANKLANNDEAILFSASGTFAANGNNKRLFVKLDSLYIFNPGLLAINNAHWSLKGEIIRTGPAQQKCHVTLTTTSPLIPAYVNISIGLIDLTGIIDLVIGAEGISDNDIVGASFRVRWEPSGG